MQWLARTQALIGEQALSVLQSSKVAVVGLGGVGGAAAEALCRAGVGTLILVDHDTVDDTNLNRQLFATRPYVGISKGQAAADRLHSIAEDCRLILHDRFYAPEDRGFLLDNPPDFIVDAIDTVSCKLDLIEQCCRRGIPIISSMGTGNRLDPTRFCLGDIGDTAGCGCGLARVLRRELKKRGITGLPVVYSTEPPQKTLCLSEDQPGRHSPASISFCPPAAGYCLASYVVRRLIRQIPAE